MLSRMRRNQRASFWALALYAAQLLIAPLAHEAAHATEILRSSARSHFHGDQAQLHAPCALPCSDPTHHHEQAVDTDHARTCSVCTGLSAPARTEAIDAGYYDLGGSRLEIDERDHLAKGRDRQPGAPRGPPQLL